MAVPVDQALRLLRAVRSGHMTKEEAEQALQLLDDGRPLSAAEQDPDGTRLLAALDGGSRAALYALPTAEVAAQRWALIQALTVEDLERGET